MSVAKIAKFAKLNRTRNLVDLQYFRTVLMALSFIIGGGGSKVGGLRKSLEEIYENLAHDTGVYETFLMFGVI